MFETFPAEVTDGGRLKLVPVDVQAEEIHVYLWRQWAEDKKHAHLRRPAKTRQKHRRYFFFDFTVCAIRANS